MKTASWQGCWLCSDQMLGKVIITAKRRDSDEIHARCGGEAQAFRPKDGTSWLDNSKHVQESRLQSVAHSHLCFSNILVQLCHETLNAVMHDVLRRGL